MISFQKGTKLIPDNGFNCMPGGVAVTVDEDVIGRFVPCSKGRHYLDGQLQVGKIVGFKRASE